MFRRRPKCSTSWTPATASHAGHRGGADGEALGDVDGDAGLLTLGQVNATLFEIRVGLLGGELECLADCQACGAVVSSELDVGRIRAAHGSPTAAMPVVDRDGRHRHVRLPTAADLAAVESLVDGRGADLVRAIVVDAGDAMPDVAVEQLQQFVLQRDPLAYVELALACPDCGHRWNAALHAIDVLWSELEVLAMRLLREVARLAQAFGWREADILAMTPRRRDAYLAMVAS